MATTMEEWTTPKPAAPDILASISLADPEGEAARSPPRTGRVRLGTDHWVASHQRDTRWNRALPEQRRVLGGRVDLQRPDRGVGRDHEYGISQVLEVLTHGQLADSGWRVDGEEDIVRVQRDPGPLIRAEEDARDYALAVAHHYVPALEFFLTPVQEYLACAARRQVKRDGRLNDFQVVAGREEEILKFRGHHGGHERGAPRHRPTLE
jgi:hypothetical protein